MFANPQTTQLINEAQGDAYKLSIPLLLASQTGDDHNYDDARNKMQTAMMQLSNDASKNSYAAWLYGRMAIAAQFKHDNTSDARIKLQALLQNKETQADRFKAWAYGYLASLNQQDFDDVKPAMQKLADKLTEDYQGINKDKLSLSDVSWVWVMVLQAAAPYDEILYTHAIKQLRAITKTNSLSRALTTGIPEEDFNQWSKAIAYVAAKQRNDVTNMTALESAKTDLRVNTPDGMLAQVTYQRANNTIKGDKKYDF